MSTVDRISIAQLSQYQRGSFDKHERKPIVCFWIYTALMKSWLPWGGSVTSIMQTYGWLLRARFDINSRISMFKFKWSFIEDRGKGWASKDYFPLNTVYLWTFAVIVFRAILTKYFIFHFIATKSCNNDYPFLPEKYHETTVTNDYEMH